MKFLGSSDAEAKRNDSTRSMWGSGSCMISWLQVRERACRDYSVFLMQESERETEKGGNVMLLKSSWRYPLVTLGLAPPLALEALRVPNASELAGI